MKFLWCMHFYIIAHRFRVKYVIDINAFQDAIILTKTNFFSSILTSCLLLSITSFAFSTACKNLAGETGSNNIVNYI